MKAGDVIWQSTLDERYSCLVTRDDDYHGFLTITDIQGEAELIYSRSVGLAFGAVVGPDVDDVDMWQDICVGVIDKRA